MRNYVRNSRNLKLYVMKRLFVFALALFVTFVSYSQVGYVNGSDFGNYFQTLYKLNQFESMVDITSKASVDKHGKDKILKFYENMQFGYDLGKLKAHVKNGDNTITLIYSDATIDATRVKKTINIVEENGKLKVVLPDNLDDFMR